MDNTFQTSFIPKKNVISGAGGKQPPKSVLTIIAAIILVVAIALCVGLFVYKKTLIQKKVIFSADLAKVKNSFQKESVDKLLLYSNRVKVAQQILDNHVVLSPLFALLSKLTLREVQFTKFNHSTTPAGFEVKMSGVTSNYKALALQADVFNGPLATSLNHVVFSNIAKDVNNKITFELKFLVSPSLLSYSKNEQASEPLPEISTSSSTPQPTTPPAAEPITSPNPIIKP